MNKKIDKICIYSIRNGWNVPAYSIDAKTDVFKSSYLKPEIFMAR